ncbi:MAG: hypothetical protein AAGK92_05680 [Pseudomonadota bacterium]
MRVNDDAYELRATKKEIHGMDGLERAGTADALVYINTSFARREINNGDNYMSFSSYLSDNM